MFHLVPLPSALAWSLVTLPKTPATGSERQHAVILVRNTETARLAQLPPHGLGLLAAARRQNLLLGLLLAARALGLGVARLQRGSNTYGYRGTKSEGLSQREERRNMW